VTVAIFLKAVLIGLSIAAPVGPIGLLCIQRTLAQGARVGFVSGLGAAVADACYGSIGAFGLLGVMHFFVALASPLAVIGAVILGWLGIQTWRAPVAETAAAAPTAAHGGKAFASVLLLTLGNPATILSFLAVFASLGGGTLPGSVAAGVMVLGVFAGSALWWLTLALGVAALRHKISPLGMRRINQAAGCCLIAIATWHLLHVLG
jgi:threonine/homoserine/homoserine lactone efflux protein